MELRTFDIVLIMCEHAKRRGAFVFVSPFDCSFVVSPYIMLSSVPLLRQSVEQSVLFGVALARRTLHIPQLYYPDDPSLWSEPMYFITQFYCMYGI